MYSNQLLIENTNSNLIEVSNDEPYIQIKKMVLDGRHLQDMLDRISISEDSEGNYDYSSISNIGMVYLYVHNRGRKRKIQTKVEYVRELLKFIEYVRIIGKANIKELSRFDMETLHSLLIRKYTKPKTSEKKLVIIRSFLTWCFEEGYLTKNISRGLRSIASSKPNIPERDIEESDLKRAIIYYADHPKTQSLLIILGISALRLNEVITPKWGDLYFDKKRGRYYLKTLTKRDKVRHAHIKDYALKVLIEYRKRLGLNIAINADDQTPFYPNRFGRHYSLSSLSTYLSKQMADAKLTTIYGGRVTPHYLRHYFAQTAYTQGAPLDWISETLGHSSSTITKENYLSKLLKKERDVSDFVDLDIGEHQE
ncbi:tyrosine-type recombinase/integrase [Bacillus sp. FJAT-28004]|uniref:tyrosine-type recombinase/integrase n=1 Tax=Bacillus sp. FJAT-28004 TaxID=1679165 RepID=UPI0006B522BA|nr:tyrosine-type recombinase/integrase [Bacillus sp. FJAT-28004]